QSGHAALRFGLRSCAAGPTLYDLKRDEPEQQLPGGLQIESQIFCNLLHGPGAIELRAELGLIRSEFQLLDTIEAFSRVAGIDAGSKPPRCSGFWTRRKVSSDQSSTSGSPVTSPNPPSRSAFFSNMIH